MTEINQIQDEELRCIGCGAVIQTDDPQGLGFTPNSALEKGKKLVKFIVNVALD